MIRYINVFFIQIYEMSGKLIVIEGCDGTGKETQTKLSIDKLKSLNIPVGTMSFPQYDSEWVRKIKDYLSDKYKDVFDNDPWPPSFLYAMDRERVSPRLETMLAQGKNVVLDRYMESNLAYQGAKILGQERTDLISKLSYFEHDVLGIPRSDFVIYLDLPLEEIVKSIKKRKEEEKLVGKSTKDIHEEDIKYQGQVRDTYLELAFSRKNWRTINCMKKDGSRLSREEVSTLVWVHMSEVLNVNF